VAMSNDELQKAIDDITSGDAATNNPSTTPADNGTASVPLPEEISGQTENTNALEDFAGAPPAVQNFDIPAMPPVSDDHLTEESAAATLKSAAENNNFSNNMVATGFSAGAPVVNNNPPAEPPLAPEPPAVSEPELPPAPVAPAGPEVVMPNLDEGPKDPELQEVENAALLELYPLLEKMNVNPREKFDICIKVIEKTKEKGAAQGALNAAKEIKDETEKGECLVKLVEVINQM